MIDDNLVQICSSSELNDPDSMGFELEHEGNLYNLFVVHKYGEFFAYVNSCPHQGSPLEWQEHEFLDMDNEFIQCTTHDALFEIPTGLCVKGPCIGAGLTPLELVHNGDKLLVRLN